MNSKVLNVMSARAFRIALVALVVAVTATGVVSAQGKGQRITPNFRDVEISQVIEAVAQVTGKTIIPDPRVRTNVTMLSQTPMTPEAFYEAFLALLQVHSYVAVESGGIIRVIPDAQARQMPNLDLPDRIQSGSEELVTQVVAVENVQAAQLVPVLRPLMPQNAHMAAYPAGNILILSDRASNVARVMRIIKRIDQQGDNEVDIINLQHASAAEVVRVVNTFYAQQAAAEGGGSSPTRVIADDRSNSVLIGGDKSARLRIKALVAHLDTPLESGGDTRVIYLQYADAEKIATKLKEQISATVAITGGAPAGGAQGGGGGVAASADRSTTIWAEPETNALVITAPAKVMKSLLSVIEKLDIRRAQVLVEAIIVDVQVTKDAELGVNWAVWSEDSSNIPLGTFQSPVGGVNLAQLAQAVDNPSSAPAALGTGTTFGIGRIAATGVNFAAMIRALQGDSNTNLISTPSAVTMDNQEAQIKVAQEVPFITGQYTNTGSGQGDVNPFTTVQRQEVGTILKITPQLNQGGSLVQLKINIESSALSGSTGDAGSAITNKRTIDTNVLIEDGGIVVLGGLIQDGDRRGEQRVPYLGRIPILGALFKTRSRNYEKRNLMVFIRPKILDDGIKAAIETDAKYNYIRDEQIKTGRPKSEVLPLLPFTPEPRLPPIPSPLPPRDTTPVPPRDSGAADGATAPQPQGSEPAQSPPAQTPPQ
ncbi:MAG TPA: type II secretion system secretin GspD [Steroidobacteraceae bacterium]|jgi:general secretion pathway protein D|nr:type II secretion system secretin GspD [Steroidobacteraceae bacterium]